jgi:hypothetical protein
MTPLLSSICATALIFAGCAQTGTYYEADATGGFRKVPDVIPGHRSHSATYVINGRAFHYNFRAIGSGEIKDAGPTHLAPGKYKRTFYKLQDAPMFSSGRAVFGGIIRCLHKANATTDGLESKRDSGGDTENIFKRKDKSAVVEYRQVNGLRWVVTTQFRDTQRQSVTNRIYHTVIGGLLITLYVDLDTSTPLKADWAQSCLDALDRLVLDFRYLEPKV